MGARTQNGVESELCEVEVTVVPVGATANYDTIWIGAGETFTGLKATAIPPEGESSCASEIAWTIGNTSIAKIDLHTGAITGVRAGKTKAVAWTVNGKYAVVNVGVLNGPNWFNLGATSTVVGAEGGTVQMIPTFPSGTVSATLVYFSSDNEIAEVDENGVVTGKKPGSVTITAWAYNGKGAACGLTVLGKPEKLTLNTTSLAITTGQTSKVSAQAQDASGAEVPADVTYYISGQSEDKDCITVNERTGEVTGVHRGKALVGARTQNGVESELCEVEVTVVPAAVTVNYGTVWIGLGETFTGLKATVIPPEGETSCASTIGWTSEYPDTVRVDTATGAITGVRTGSSRVVAWTVNGKYAIVNIAVLNAPSRVAVSAANTVISEDGGTTQLSVSVPNGTACATWAFTSSDPEIAEVSPSGLVTAKKEGQVEITAWAYNGVGASVTITVTGKPSKLVFTQESAAICTGETTQLTAQPLSASGQNSVASVSYYIVSETREAACVQLDAATGAVTGLRRGTARIGARTPGGIEAEPIEVTVTVAPAAITLNYTAGYIGLGETFTDLKATLVPPEGEDSCASDVTWYSNNPGVVAVDAKTGAVYGASIGWTTIYAMTSNGKYASANVAVLYAPSAVALSPASAVMTVGQTGKLTVQLPNNTASGARAFFSSDPEVVSVDAHGNVKALATGSATITVWTFNGKGANAVISVRSEGTVSGDMPMPSSTSSYSDGMSAAEKLEYAIYIAQSNLGKPYVWGSFGPNSFDCTGFTHYCFRQIGVDLRQTAYTQGYDSSFPMISDIGALRRGDLVYFNTVDDSDLSDHAGIYLGNGYFIHASSSAGKVIVSNLSSGYYYRVFSWGRRVFY